MNKMMTIVVVGIVMLGMAGLAQAAKPAKAAKGAKGEQRTPLAMVQRALEKLDLSDDQAKKIGDIISTAQQDLQQVRDDAKASGDKTAVREKVRTIMTDTLKKVSAELTPEQKTKLREQMKEFREQRKAQHSDQSPSTQPAK